LTEIALVTGNPNKVLETRRITGQEIDSVEVDLPEIQSLDLREVLEAKAREAWNRVGRPLVVEETGLELAAMNGFPGPLVKWMLDAIGPEGIARTIMGLGDARATARCQLLVVDGNETLFAEGATTGTLVLPPRGEGGFGWDPIFQPDGHDLTYAELGSEIKDRIGHRGRAWADLVEKLGGE
jgi:non-canonical purine NTP pyrophosphatase (RdgB/HAM1 family)